MLYLKKNQNRNHLSPRFEGDSSVEEKYELLNRMKQILTTTFLVIFCTSIYAQTPNWQWARSAYGQDDAVDALGVATDMQGNVYVTGWYFGPTINFGSIFLVNSDASATDMYLVKYDSLGNVLWAKSGGGTEMEWGNKIATDASGNIYVIGEFNSPSVTFDTITLINSGWGDFFIVKYDPNGKVLWAKSAGGAGSDKGHDIATDANGNLYATGVFTSQKLIFSKDTLNNSGYEDVFIVKYDVSGNVVWAKSAGNNKDDWGKRIATDASGNIYVTGDYTSTSITFGSYTLTNKGAVSSSDVFITKYDPSGNVLWAVSAGDSLDDYGMGICTDTKANVFITGLFASTNLIFGPDTLSTAGGADIFTAKYDSSGKVLWARSGGGKGREWGEAVSANAKGNVYITGWFESKLINFDTITLTNSGGSDICVMKYDSSGKVLWAKHVEGSDDEWGQDISNDVYGNIYVTGETFSFSMYFDAIMLKTSGDGDVFLGKIKDPDLPSIIIKSQPNSLKACVGDVVTFSVGALGNNLHYQWKKNGTNISDATNDSLYISTVSLSDSGIYSCTISDTSYNVTSWGAKLSIHTAPVISENPDNVYSNIEQTASFKIIATGKDLKYQWLKNGTNIIWAKDNTCIIENLKLADEGNYRCIVNNNCGSDTSSAAELAIVIISHPENTTACEASEVVFRVKTQQSGLTFKWKKNGNDIPGETKDSLLLKNINSATAGLFQCDVSGTSFNVSSKEVSLTVTDVPSIITHPVSQVKKETQTVTFTIVASDTILTYQWQKNNTDISGATSASYTKANLIQADSGDYRCIVTNACGKDTSNTANLKVDKTIGIDQGDNESQYSIYPNPSTGLITIETAASNTSADMQIFDISGREVMQKRISEPTTTISISHLPQGLYYISLKGQKSVYIEKMVKQ